MGEEDHKTYHEECKRARDAAGLHVDDPDFCPLLVAEDLLHQAEHVLIEVMEPVTGISFDDLMCSSNGVENLRQYINLTLPLLTPFIGTADSILKGR